MTLQHTLNQSALHMLQASTDYAKANDISTQFILRKIMSSYKPLCNMTSKEIADFDSQVVADMICFKNSNN